MDLEDDERYAAAALYTLALHLVQTESGQYGDPETAWGEPPDDDDVAAASAAAAAASAASSSGALASAAASDPATAAAAAVATLAAARRAAFWGHDCVAPGGLLDRCYASLRLPPRCWPGLKRLPELGGLLGRGGRGEALALAASYVAALAGDGAGGGGRAAGAHGKGEDAALAGPASAQQQPDLADLLRPLPASPSFGSAADVAALFRGGGGGGREGDDDAAVAVAAAAAAATAEVGGDSDSDLEADLLAERLAAAALSGGRSGGGAQPYDARSRTALKRVAHWLGVPWAKVGALEALVAVELAALAAAAAGGPAAAKGEASPAPAPAPTAPPATSAREAAARAAKVAGATLGIGALFAVTGGLAAPVVAAGLSAAISAVGGSAAATAAGAAVSGFLATSAGTALVAGGVGAGGGAFAGSRMARRVGDVQEFGFWEDQRLAVTVCVSGWARSRPDFLTPWRTASVAGGGSAASASGAQPDAARFALVWESRELMRLSAIVTAWVRNQAAQEAVKLALQHWLYAGAAAAAAAPMALVSVSNSIDSAWAMALDRAVKAGRLLAHVLMGGGAGGRPVTLVGYSMGARLVFHCLLELVRCADDGRVSGGGSGAGGGPPGGGGARGGGRAAPPPHPPPTPPAPVGGAGIVEHAILLGTPVTARPERWAMARRAVAGRLLNGYCRSDWVLGVAFRASSGLIRPAGGLCPVPVPGVENVNLGAVVSGHLDYGSKVPEILALTGLAD